MTEYLSIKEIVCQLGIKFEFLLQYAEFPDHSKELLQKKYWELLNELIKRNKQYWCKSK